MASELIVQTIQGPSSGANANKVIIPSGHTLDVSSGAFIPEPDQILQVKHVQWDTTTAITTAQSYVAVNDSAITITAKATNSHFHLVATANCYQDSSGSGMNLGFFRGTTLVRGVNGASGDSWMGGGNGQGLGSYTIVKTYVDETAISAGDSVTYKVAFGQWATANGYLNYTGYNGTASNFTIMEIAQ